MQFQAGSIAGQNLGVLPQDVSYLVKALADVG
jgi:hypothetical protein